MYQSHSFHKSDPNMNNRKMETFPSSLPLESGQKSELLVSYCTQKTHFVAFTATVISHDKLNQQEASIPYDEYYENCVFSRRLPSYSILSILLLSAISQHTRGSLCALPSLGRTVDGYILSLLILALKSCLHSHTTQKLKHFLPWWDSTCKFQSSSSRQFAWMLNISPHPQDILPAKNCYPEAQEPRGVEEMCTYSPSALLLLFVTCVNVNRLKVLA